ncbi:acetyl-CoA carboxylase biotin carboxyl carrier protein [Granulibacter bethesdensis]|uniref:Biotin carboxyl carrier protein of acetyl-CoA carboxylase n=1 Tax=Granulibacter bethesdensis (strain ATCC BAA-1260 / CGDNIH1) TaxID=391165 RepID=Q0BQP6_GRABC|nr:acetyl-CoA carboxylase biotin carboxyl carrier protein [Granulibacter bethesdensis]ABI62856.1 Biotin carboxyl carrier protein of acetyl-CoA carboxylase [Granulibacter bethesdensis CGDNIH1]AHJ68190.1 Biotin carboxyl carrier protein of acetyl-CoA carboxylase [Granulibacter bethesdensis]APH52723.1 Biotin carboxyl carrier protein of acetyl-CoA carboxylase [Granulibacter bethesdensis]APH65411.1 Biotin carboxyl carrier protein of acetyl-CoA carboxylase [Granulibacter bethesdensis]
MSRVLFDAEAIRTLATILADTGLTEIEIIDNESRIRVARTPAPVTYIGGAPALAAPAVAAAPVSQVQAAPVAQEAVSAVDDAKHPGAVLSPMVGIAYLCPEPGAPSFISVGQPVTAGQTLLLIEAMKTFNQIKAAKAGTVSKILVGNGAPVEYGEPLVIIE